jgi:hypothetical protein
MSGILRFSAALALVAGLSTSPASSNPFDFLFNAAPEQAPAPARAEEECLPHPGKSTTEGQHWVYRLDGHRKCWLQVAKQVATAKKLVRPRAVKQLVATPENDAALRKRKEVVDARAELLRSASPETAQPTPSAPEFKVVDAAAVPATGAAALVPAPLVVAEPATNQLTPNHPTPSHVDVDTLLAAAPAASDAVTVSPSTPAIPIAETGDDGREWTATWLGVLLMGLGLVFLLISGRTLRGTFAFGAHK